MAMLVEMRLLSRHAAAGEDRSGARNDAFFT